ncbi:MAG: site-specific DNA-methyltransferase [Nanoarchaeota archaeon]|nr:site-specific DNA-methyltransferase [Nanoarchaeota archaeon]
MEFESKSIGVIIMENQNKLSEKEKDEFVEELNLTPEKIKEDMEKMKGVEGFPIGDDEDILELSNPPYYTAYPNPYIKKFIEKYGKPYNAETDDYKCEPFLGNESHGRTDSVYNIHFYHTKVPPQAISTYIKHYSEKDDLILDFFAGSGMTGVAALRHNRVPICIDLSPFATFIQTNNLKEINLNKFKEFSNVIYDKVYAEYSYLYQISENDTTQRNFTVWSEVQICKFCNKDYLFYKANVVGKEIECPHCNIRIKINQLKCKIDSEGKGIFEPVEIHYIEKNKREVLDINNYEEKIKKEIKNLTIPFWHPINKIISGFNTQQPMRSHGFKTVSDFFTKRNLLVIAAFFHKIRTYDIEEEYKHKLIYALTASMMRLTVLNRYMPSHNRHVGPLSGTLYVPKLYAEINPFKNFKEKIDSILKADFDYKANKYFVSTQSATKLSNIQDNSIDYIFVDPPFGDNLMYSELNFLWESWIKVFTNNEKEAIVNKVQNKTEQEYYDLMLYSLQEGYRVIKPNRWITLEFHNSRASIWRIIQESLVKAGFIIGQVLTLDKQKGTTKQLSYAGSVKNDLVINAYKPSEEFRNVFLKKAGLNMEREFILMHLDKLPIEPNVERTQQMLYSKLLAQYIQNGFEVRMDASEFYGLLKNNFIERDGFWFNSNQISEYEKRIKLSKTIKKFDISQTILWINDEKSAIIWLANFLRTPKTYSEIQQEYFPKISQTDDTMPDLKQILKKTLLLRMANIGFHQSMKRKKEKMCGINV